MIITFKSRAAGDVIMFGDVAKRLLEIMGKDPSDQGIVTVQQLPEALARLKKATDEDRAARRAAQDRIDAGEGDEDDRVKGANAVTLSQRAVPLIELLEYSLKADVPVTWGV